MSDTRWVNKAEFARLEGCDEKQVRRGVISGKLVTRADGLLDAGQVGNGWRRTRVDSKEAKADASPDSPERVRTPEPEPENVAGVPVVMSVSNSKLKAAVERKEDFAGRLKELEYRQRAGELVDLQLARKVLFDEFRSARDAWLNWPARYAALIAADLGVPADRVAEVLTGYVHKQLAALAEPGGDFSQR